jgi:hypothetical protein
VALLSHRLHHAAGLLGLGRFAFVASVMIVAVRMGFCYRERKLFKEMMDTVGRRGRDKKNE